MKVNITGGNMTKEFHIINKAKHYNLHPSSYECIDIVRHHDFCIGNAIKYLWRAGLKESENPNKEIEDLRKAVYYINDKIKQLELKIENGNKTTN